MKRILITVVFVVISITALMSADGISTVVNNVDSIVSAQTESLTFAKVYDDVKAGISGLAVALKAPAEHVYEVLVKQQV